MCNDARLWLSAIAVTALLTACGRSDVSPLPDVVQSSNTGAKITMQLHVAASLPSDGIRKPLYLSPSTLGIGISGGASPEVFSPMAAPQYAFDVSSGSGLCSGAGGARTCSLTITEPAGIDDFQLAAWDRAPSNGSFVGAKLLSSATLLHQNIALGLANTIGVTLNGAVDSIAVAVSPGAIPGAPSVANGGSPATATLTVTAKDVDGNVILGSGSYTDANGNPLTISITQAAIYAGDTVRTVLSSPTVTPSSNALTITYAGNSSYGTVFSASPSRPISGSTTSATLQITPTITEFSSGLSPNSQPLDIVAGPDGNLWFLENARNAVGRVTPAGVISEFSLGNFAPYYSRGLTTASDGNLWFASPTNNGIARLTTSGTETGFSAGITSNSVPSGISTGPDGNLWFTEQSGNRIGRITTSGVVTEFSSGITAGASPFEIASGPDGNLWFTESQGNRIGRITTAGVVTEFSGGISSGSYPWGITSGPDGNVWFSEEKGGIGRITTAGTVTEFPAFPAGGTPVSSLGEITTGPDGNIWFAVAVPARIERITTSGLVTDFSAGITSGAGLYGISAGPDGNIWFTEFQGNRLGRLIY